MTKYAFQNKV